MKLIKPSAEIIHITPNALQHIEAAGRTCYKSEDKITDTSAEKFVKNIIQRGHESVLEHSVASVRFICDRGVSHEIVRHRIASYSQESTRYVNYGSDDVTFILPPWANVPYELQDKTFEPLTGFSHDQPLSVWLHACAESERSYKTLLKQNMSPQMARAVLNNSLKTELVMTANLREWRHFFKMRCDKAAHPQMRELTLPLLEQFHNRVPVVFDDLYEEFLDEIR